VAIAARPRHPPRRDAHRNVRLTDITPTICDPLGVPVPHDTEGASLYQALEA
jgi:arylsulfatase A-like enzyme